MSTKIVAARFEQNLSATEVFGEKVWRCYGHFNNQKPDYNIEKVNCLENTIFYLNQAYLAVRKNKKIYYGNFYILG